MTARDKQTLLDYFANGGASANQRSEREEQFEDLIDSLSGVTTLTVADVGATTVTVNRIPEGAIANGFWIVIDPWTTECEIRKVTAISSTTLTVAALTYAHNNGDAVIFTTELIANVKWFGALGDGSTDDSAAIQAAFDDVSDGGIYFPTGVYEVNTQITIADAATIDVFGDGYGSQIRVYLNDFAFSHAGAAALGRTSFRNMSFESDEGTYAAGGIELLFTTTGITFENLWFLDVKFPLKLYKTWGNAHLSNINARMADTEVAGSIGIDIGDTGAVSSNAVFIRGVSIVGGYVNGVKAEQGAVLHLQDFNISGTGSIEMTKGVELIDYDRVTVQNGWIEGILQPTATNGEGEAIVVTDCDQVEVNNVNIAVGSVYLDNSTVEANRIKFAQASGGWSVTNEAKLVTSDIQDDTTERGAMSNSVTGTDYDGLWIDKVSNEQGCAAVNAEPVVTPISGNKDVAPSNVSFSTLSRDTSIWLSGGGSIKAVVTQAWHGYTFTFAGIKANTEYTFIVKAYLASGGSATFLNLTTGANTSYNGSQPQRLRTYTTDAWANIHASFQSSTTTITINLSVNDSGTAYVDSYALLRGTANYKDPMTTVYEGWNKAIPALANDATPSISGSPGSRFWLTGGTTTITDIDDGWEGKLIAIIAEHSLDITDGTNIFLNGSANWSMTATDTLTLIQKADGKWYEVSRGDNGA
jgi:hypothetical protein